ncbi:unnamed protein product, partial [Owenia fusiformis]
GSIIGVYTDDSAEEYCFYLAMAVGSVFEKPDDGTDDWEQTVPRGALVVQALYYKLDQQDPYTYTVIKERRATLPYGSVVYILPICDQTKVTESKFSHDDIIGIIDDMSLVMSDNESSDSFSETESEGPPDFITQ